MNTPTGPLPFAGLLALSFSAGVNLTTLAAGEPPLTEFGAAIAAFHRDMGDRMADVVMLTMSEFGRTVRQNGNRGTDHGHATCFFALGGAVNGGKVLGKWPGLAPGQLFEGRDLEVTTDYRDVFAEIASQHLGVRDPKKVFPNFKLDPKNLRGVLKA